MKARISHKTLICVRPCQGLELNAEYRAMQETDGSYQVHNDNGEWHWYKSNRFIVKPC